jgi:hypothetical protein
MYILKRAPFDEFTFRLFVQMSSNLPEDHDSFYTSSAFLTDFMYTSEHPEVLKSQGERIETTTETSVNGPVNFYRNLIKNNIKNNVILIGIKDHLTAHHYNPWIDIRPNILEFLIQIFEENTDKNFIFCTSLENLDYYVNLDNVYIIPWGGDITNQIFSYRNIEPVNVKFPGRMKNFLCLNRNHRFHREMLLSFMITTDLLDNSLVSCMFKNNINDYDRDFWIFNSSQEFIKKRFLEGRNLIKDYNWSIDDNYEIYKEESPNDNVSNFKNVLKNYYSSTCIEIITETTFFEKYFLITEKTANCILGCCFPIWVSPPGTVKFLRERGFDVFDDVIDHSYDLVENHIDRIHRCIYDNLDILSNCDKSYSLWEKNKHRFLNNIEVLKFKLPLFYENRTKNLFDNFIKNKKCMIL